MLPLHPDDVLFFTEVADVIRAVAKQHKLPLSAVEAMTMPAKGMSDRLGECSHSGVIRLVLRCTVDGQFCDDPMSPDEVYRTAAHELAHLKHFNHGFKFQEYELEMQQAVAALRPDRKQKLIDKLLKMQASRDGEAKLGNSAAAEAFAAAINRMLTDHELSASDLDYARAQDDNPVVEVSIDLTRYRIAAKRNRVAWQENLARVVASSHLCTFLIRPGSNVVTFVGTRSHATVAEYAYGTMVRAAQTLCHRAYHEYGLECGRKAGVNKWIAGEPGFNESWLGAFIERIAERFKEARAAAVKESAAEAADVKGATSQALMRLDGALVRARKYVDDKFRGSAAPLKRISARHAEGRARGRAAANAMTIGRKGVTGSTGRKLLN